MLRPYARRLVGVDLSTGMLVRARGVGAYDELAQAELTAYLQDQSHAYDVIVCADTLCYFGDLAPVLTAAAGALRPDGCFAFTLEAAGSDDDTWLLNQGGRYAHSRHYVELLLGSVGFTLQRIDSMVLRKEGGTPVDGHLVVAAI